MDKSGRPPVAISTPKNRNPKTQKCYRCIDPNVLPMSSLHAARLSPLTSHFSLLTSHFSACASPSGRFIFSAVGNDGDDGAAGARLHTRRPTSTLEQCHPNDPSTATPFRNWKTGAETGAKSRTGRSNCFSGFSVSESMSLSGCRIWLQSSANNSQRRSASHVSRW
jgi:hypothetical protein